MTFGYGVDNIVMYRLHFGEAFHVVGGNALVRDYEWMEKFVDRVMTMFLMIQRHDTCTLQRDFLREIGQ